MLYEPLGITGIVNRPVDNLELETLGRKCTEQGKVKCNNRMNIPLKTSVKRVPMIVDLMDPKGR